MFKLALLPLVAAAAILGSTLVAGAQTTMSAPGAMSAMGGMEHGMPEGKMGADGDAFTGGPFGLAGGRSRQTHQAVRRDESHLVRYGSELRGR